MGKLSIIKQTSFIKTMKFNYHYFGWRGVIKPQILISRNVRIKKLGGKIQISNPTVGGIKFGYGHVGIIDEIAEKSVWESNGIVIFHRHANLDIGTRIVCGENAILDIGENCHIMGRSSIICLRKITIGRDCLISWDNLFMDTDFHKVFDTTGTRINPNKEICIENHVWIGCRCLILKGASIPSNSVIAAGSTVSKILSDENTIYVGNIGKKSSVEWKA